MIGVSNQYRSQSVVRISWPINIYIDWLLSHRVTTWNLIIRLLNKMPVFSPSIDKRCFFSELCSLNECIYLSNDVLLTFKSVAHPLKPPITQNGKIIDCKESFKKIKVETKNNTKLDLARSKICYFITHIKKKLVIDVSGVCGNDLRGKQGIMNKWNLTQICNQ